MRPFRTLRKLGKTLFHRRNIIVISERSTSHFSFSGKMQFIFIFALMGVIGSGSYSTGQYMAAQQVISEQGQTIKSVASERVEDSFAYVPSLSPRGFELLSSSKQAALSPLMTNGTMPQGELLARIAYLNSQVKELEKTNKDIITTVRLTAGNQIADLENIISRTGLNANILSRQANRTVKVPVAPAETADEESLPWAEEGQGGPFIPDSMNEDWETTMQQFTDELQVSVGQLAVLRRLVDALPLASPVTKARTASKFGRRIDPFHRKLAFHAGLDLAAVANAKVYSTSDGVVTHAARRGAYGNMVEVNHGYGISTRYAHLSRIHVVQGQKVKKGQIVGAQGSTGRSTGPHVHYEVRFNNRPIDPANFLAAGKQYVSQK